MKTRLDSPTRPTRRRWPLAALIALALPALGGAQGDGCAANSSSPAPDVTGSWGITYDDTLDVEIGIGGAVYNETLTAAGGVISIDHEGTIFDFDLDCDRPEIVCPSEAWPNQVSVEQRNTQFEHRMIVKLPTQVCEGSLRAPSADECGAGTNNPDCDDICDGAVSVTEQERFGVIGETGETFRLFLGGGIATNGFNCALLAGAVADADLDTEGGPNQETWEAVGMSGGLVTVGYAGGCLWIGDPDMDAELEALVIGASVTFRTGFTGDKL